MTVNIKLNNLFIRIIWAVTCLLFCLLAVRFIYSHFLIRNIADRRIMMSLDVLSAAVSRFPNSSRARFRLAEAEADEATTDLSKLQVAHEDVLRVVNLAPWDYKNWRLLALVKEADGKVEDALRVTQIAVNLAPNHSEVNWALANLLLRQNKLNESLPALRTATATRTDLLPTAMDLIWQASGNDLMTLNTLTQGSDAARLMQAQFLAEQGQTEAAINVFHNVASQAKLSSTDAPAFIARLIQSNYGSEARRLWLDVVGETDVKGNEVWNGSFEQTPPKDFQHFDWTLKASNYARIGFDRNMAHSGTKSLKLIFVGQNSTKLENEIEQMVVLQANTHYRFECYAKALNLVTQEGPRIALRIKQGLLVVSDPIDPATTDWQRLSVEFTSPSESSVAYVSIIRTPHKEYDGPTRGTVWFDDFKLTAVKE